MRARTRTAASFSSHYRRAHCNGKHTVFGKVTRGKDVVDKISMVERDARDMPKTPVVLEKVELS